MTDKIITQTILERVRLMKGLTQQELAHKAGCSQPAVSNAERGYLKTEKLLERMADALGWHADPKMLQESYTGQSLQKYLVTEAMEK